MSEIPNQRGRKITRLGQSAAIGILVVFGLILLWMMHVGRNEADLQWGRLLVLYQGVEALAFAAAGALLGTQVQRAQVDAAETRAERLDVERSEASSRADRAETAGRALRHAIESAAPARGALESQEVEDGSLTELARRLFPD